MWIHTQLNWNRSSARKLRVSLCSEVKTNAQVLRPIPTRCIRWVDVLRYLKASPTLHLSKQIKSSHFALRSRRRSKPVCRLTQSSRVLFRSSRCSGGTHTNPSLDGWHNCGLQNADIIHLSDAAQFVFVNNSIL